MSTESVNLPFAIVPAEVAMDDRLSKGELRLLVALYSFRNRNTELCCPKREDLEARTGYSTSMISRMTTKLKEHGWVSKSGDGRFGKSNNYKLHVPDTIVATAATIAATATVATAATPIVAATATPIVATAATLKKQTINRQVNRQKEIPELPAFVDPEKWADWIQHRKEKKNPATPMAQKKMVTELTKLHNAGHDVNECIDYSIANGWAGVFAPSKQNNRQQQVMSTPASRSREIMERRERERQANERNS